MRHLIPVGLIVAFASAAAQAEPATEYQPLAFLAGHCWTGTFSDGQQTDEHCFTWVYNGRFVRDRHTVRGSGHPDSFGETIYFWNSAAKQLEYLYIESQGGFSRGVVGTALDALVFPPTSYVENGQTRSYRSRWSRSSEDAYDVVTEFQSGDSWQEGFRVHMKRSGEASP